MQTTSVNNTLGVSIPVGGSWQADEGFDELFVDHLVFAPRFAGLS